MAMLSMNGLIWWSTRDTCRCIQGIIGLLVTYMWIVDTRWSLGHLPPLQQLTLVNHPNPKDRVTLQILQDMWAIYSCQSVLGEQTFFWWNILKLTSKYIWVNTINRWTVDKMNHRKELFPFDLKSLVLVLPSMARPPIPSFNFVRRPDNAWG